MIGVDLIGEIRRAYFEQRRPIKDVKSLPIVTPSKTALTD
jgi:hypothetical protein